MICLDLGEFFDDGGIGLRKAPDSGECLGGSSKIVSFDHVARGVRKNQHSSDQDKSPGELNSNRYAI